MINCIINNKFTQRVNISLKWHIHCKLKKKMKKGTGYEKYCCYSLIRAYFWTTDRVPLPLAFLNQ